MFHTNPKRKRGIFVGALEERSLGRKIPRLRFGLVKRGQSRSSGRLTTINFRTLLAAMKGSVRGGTRAAKRHKSIARGASPWYVGRHCSAKAPTGRQPRIVPSKSRTRPDMPRSFASLPCHIEFSTKRREPRIDALPRPRSLCPGPIGDLTRVPRHHTLAGIGATIGTHANMRQAT